MLASFHCFQTETTMFSVEPPTLHALAVLCLTLNTCPARSITPLGQRLATSGVRGGGHVCNRQLWFNGTWSLSPASASRLMCSCSCASRLGCDSLVSSIRDTCWTARGRPSSFPSRLQQIKSNITNVSVVTFIHYCHPAPVSIAPGERRMLISRL